LLSAVDLLGTYVGGRAELANWLEDAEINRDRNLRLQYLAGLALNEYQADAIFDNMTAAGQPAFPEALFTGAPTRLEELRQRMRARPRDR
jgi:spermidine synthase